MTDKSSQIKANRTQWFRLYAEALDDPKVQRLPPHLFKTWVNLMALACKRGGVFGRDEVAFALRMSDHDAASQIDELIGLGLLDIQADGKIEPHNWETRQFVSDTSTYRVRKHRERKKERACNGGETFHVAAPETETETETEKIPPNPHRGLDDPSPAETSQARPVASWSNFFTPADDASGVIRTEAGSIQLINGTRQLWLEKFSGDAARLDAALIEISGAINEGSRKPLAADVQGRLGRILGQRLDRDRSYQTAVVANAAAKAAPRPVKLSRW